jgi:transmembrane sensor
MTPESFKELLDRYSRGECTQEEREYVERWYENLSYSHPPVTGDLEEKLWRKIKPPVGGTVDISFSLRIAASIGVIAIISGLVYWGLFRINDAPIAEKATGPVHQAAESKKTLIKNDSKLPKRIALEDGSIITLQPDSELSLPEQFTHGERTVSLRGEAFFDIRRDTLRPFYVYTGDVVTKVLGTSFNIKASQFEREVTVAVKTGKVSVFTKRGKEKSATPEVILTPNQQAVYNANDIVVKKEIVPEPEIVLEEPTIFKMKYDETPVTEIFHVLEENYGVDIEFNEEALKNCVLTTTMSNEGLFDRIAIICRAINATYTLDNAVIRIDGRGCQ